MFDCKHFSNFCLTPTKAHLLKAQLMPDSLKYPAWGQNWSAYMYSSGRLGATNPQTGWNLVLFTRLIRCHVHTKLIAWLQTIERSERMIWHANIYNWSLSDCHSSPSDSLILPWWWMQKLFLVDSGAGFAFVSHNSAIKGIPALCAPATEVSSDHLLLSLSNFPRRAVNFLPLTNLYS